MTPAGTAFDFQPTLQGERLVVRPLRADDWDALYAAASDPVIWALHPESDRWQRPVFEQFFAEALKCGAAFAILERASGRIIGSSRYYEFDAARSEVAIGYTFLTRDHWGGATNGELKALMLDHAFQVVRAVIFHVGESNLRSRRAVEKLGAVLVGSVVRPSRNGALRNNVVYRLERR